jgi:hypothetical protein
MVRLNCHRDLAVLHDRFRETLEMDFGDLFLEVVFLNDRLRQVEHDLGSVVRRATYDQLWGIVGELNERLNLGLDNTCLDLKAVGDQLVIHYWFGVESPYNSHEVNIYINRSFSVERYTKDLNTGDVEITRMPA